MDQRDRFRDPAKIVGPVERGVAAAHDQAPLSGQRQLVLDQVLHAETLEALDPVDLEPPRLERADPGGDDDRPGEPLALVGADPPYRYAPVPVALGGLELGGRFRESHLGMELHRLLDQPLGEIAGEDLGESPHVVDVLLGVEGG